ncbi:CMRF35-like molecule 2 [Dipodomys spectabilis]|uniref:CMRF35-like molecule 2 n=1 Tax=Dipodomys spectabilis TaxID=105255 RepID=UPI001C54481B|nr:CMRF35-like molecule 2 [Dipodomys spectabilis]
MWLSPVLLLLCFRGCWSLTGPGSVTGTEGGSLRVQCRYDEGYRGYNKYWCKGEHDIECESIVQTHGNEEEVRSGRVSIRDNGADATMVVTIRDLREEDAGPYWCKIQTVWILDELSRDPAVAVTLYVSPATTTPMVITTSATPLVTATSTTPLVTATPTTPLVTATSTTPLVTATSTTPLVTATSTTPLVTAIQNLSTNRVSAVYSWSLFSSVYVQILITLKLLLLLGVLCAVVWVNRAQRIPRQERVAYLGLQKAVFDELSIQLGSSSDYRAKTWTLDKMQP